MTIRFEPTLKALSIISLFLLFGCAPSTQNLIEQAHLTGDWSLVNKRLELIERRKAQRPQSCPTGTTAFCNNSSGDKNCGCVDNSEMRDMLASMGW